jgi:hypothetical protein
MAIDPLTQATFANGVYDHHTIPAFGDGALLGMGGNLPWLDVRSSRSTFADPGCGPFAKLCAVVGIAANGWG